MRFIRDLLIKPQTTIFLGWVFAIHLLELIVLPSMINTSQILSNLTLTERLVNIWTSSADTAHYLLIAKNGYEFANKTLFPLWPIVLSLTGAKPIVAKILALFLTFCFLTLLTKLIKNLGYQKDSEEIILSFIAFPASFMLLAPMSEPLYLLLTVLTILSAENKKFFKSSIFALLASATRSIGLLLTLYLAVRLIQNGKPAIKKFWWTLLLSPLGFIAYALYLELAFGNFALLYTQQSAWGRSLGMGSFPNLLNETLTTFAQITGPVKPVPINILHFGLIFFFIFLSVISFRKLNKGLWLYSVFAIIVPLASGTSVAISRYILSAFPLFIPLGNFFKKHPTMFYFYLFFSILFQSVLLIRFFNFEVAD